MSDEDLASVIAWGTVEHGEEHGTRLALEALQRVRAEENEACARVMEDLAAKAHEFGECRNEGQRLMCAAAIRARREG